MKFQQLPVGTRFEYDGRIYVKSGPLTAAGESGGQRIIPRSAVLRPLDAPADPKPKAGRRLDEARVLAAFEAFHGECVQLLHEAVPDTLRGSTLRARLEAARQRFLDGLGGAPGAGGSGGKRRQ